MGMFLGCEQAVNNVGILENFGLPVVFTVLKTRFNREGVDNMASRKFCCGKILKFSPWKNHKKSVHKNTDTTCFR